MKLPKQIDNKKIKMIDELKEYVTIDSKLSVISGYFTIYAYEALRKELLHIDSMRFIFTEPTFVSKKNNAMREFYIKKNNNVFGTEFEIKLRNEMTQSAIAKECTQWIRDKVSFKSFKEKNPAYPRNMSVVNNDDVLLLQGSVDFTTDAFGVTPSTRADSIVAIYGKEMTRAMVNSFEDIWTNTELLENVTDLVLSEMQVLHKENHPEFIYFLALYNIFHAYLDELTEDSIIKSRTGFKETVIWNKLYQFQKDGVVGAIDKIEKHNGCIIADSVGLGKTYTGLAIIKYYELRNDRVLVLCPKKLRDNWTVYTQNDKRNIFVNDRFGYDVLNHTDLSRVSGYSGEMNLASIHWGNYDLVVIDESHNFRNNPSVKDRTTRYQRMMDDIIKSGVKTKVLMLSATPVNNRMNDIKNQIAFITEGDNQALNSLGIKNIENTLRKAQEIFNRWSDTADVNRTSENFVAMMDLDYFKILDALTIARSRKHIEKYYDINEVGKFPVRRPPRNIYSEIDITKQFPDISAVNQLIAKLTLAVYSPLAYVLPQKRRDYETKYDMAIGSGDSVFKQADRESSLIHLIRINMLKRMESSVHSFAITVGNLLEKVYLNLDAIANHNDLFEEDLNILDIDPDDSEFENLLFGNNVKVLLRDMDLIKWQQDLRLDTEKLEEILEAALKVTPDKDKKLDTLKRTIAEKIKNPINPNNNKILIFTAFADTANYLYDQLSPTLKKAGLNSAIVTGGGSNKSTFEVPAAYKNQIKFSDINTVLTLFSPISKEGSKIFPYIDDEIDVLIATDCISEGQNLQDCDFVVNYDIHWNPVRIIQRFGRIDRIGSLNEEIQLVNFWPTKDLDDYINLEQRVQGRMVLLDVSATGEENLIESDGTKEMKDLMYRKKQLERLQNEVVDLEDISGGISITDLTFSDFKVDLMNYLKDNREKLEKAPTGLYSIAKIDKNLKEEVQPGVIFVLEQVKGSQQAQEQNPLYPYYLVYVTNDGEVELSFQQAKRMLDYFKKMSAGKKEVDTPLVERFNLETQDGTDMGMYSRLLEIAIENIVGTKEKVGLDSLFSKGGTTLLGQSVDGLNDFELISFLILKDDDK